MKRFISLILLICVGMFTETNYVTVLVILYLIALLNFHISAINFNKCAVVQPLEQCTQESESIQVSLSSFQV